MSPRYPFCDGGGASFTDVFAVFLCQLGGAVSLLRWGRGHCVPMSTQYLFFDGAEASFPGVVSASFFRKGGHRFPMSSRNLFSNEGGIVFDVFAVSLSP